MTWAQTPDFSKRKRIWWRLKVTWWIFIGVTSSVWLCVVVIEISADGGISGDSPPHRNRLPLYFCSPQLSLCRSIFTATYLRSGRNTAAIARFRFLHFALFSVSPSFLRDPLSLSPVALFFSSSHRFFKTAPSRGATQPCSNCFLQLHWAIETEWPLMLNSPLKTPTNSWQGVAASNDFISSASSQSGTQNLYRFSLFSSSSSSLHSDVRWSWFVLLAEWCYGRQCVSMFGRVSSQLDAAPTAVCDKMRRSGRVCARFDVLIISLSIELSIF